MRPHPTDPSKRTRISLTARPSPLGPAFARRSNRRKKPDPCLAAAPQAQKHARSCTRAHWQADRQRDPDEAASYNFPTVCAHSLRMNFVVIGAAKLNLFITTVIGCCCCVLEQAKCEYVKRTSTSNVRVSVCRVSSAVWVPDALAAEYCLFVSRCRHVRLSWRVRGFCDTSRPRPIQIRSDPRST